MAQTPEGIMALPNEPQAAEMPQLTLTDSYDAMQTSLQNAQPEAAAQLKQLMAQLMPMMDQLSDTQLDQLLQLVQYLQDNEEQYPEIRKKLIAEGMDEEDLPPEYDPEYFASIGTVVLEAIRLRSAAAGTPPQQFARGGIAQAAHMLASKGRGQDTQLAHITPAEARMLRKKGGVGTINPDTGLPEFGLWGSIVGVVKSTWKRVTGAVKSVLKSPVGRILATVALATFLGPGAFGITGLGFGAGTAAAASSGLITLASGGNLKDALISAGTAWLGSAASPLAGFAGKAASSILPAGVSPALTQGLSSTLVGTGVGLLTGKNLQESVKSGLSSAILNYGVQKTAEMGNLPGRNAPVSGREMRGEGLPAIEDRIPVPDQLKVFGQPDVAGLSGMPSARPTFTGMAGTPPPASMPGMTAQAPAFVTGTPPAAGGPLATTAGPIGETSYQTAGAGIRAIETPAISGTSGGGGLRAPVNALGVSDLSAGTAAFPRIQQISAQAPAPTPSGGIPSVRDSLTEMYEGAKGTNWDKFSKGAGDLFMPGTPDSSAIMGSQQYKDLTSQGISADKAYTMVEKSMTPGMLRTYGPGVAAGLGVMGLTGGFNQDNPQVDLEKFWGPSSAELMKANPRKYYIQNIPGVTYSQQGAVVPRGYEDGGTVTPDPLDPKNFMVGTEYATPQFTMDDIRVATPTLEQREAEMANYTPVTSTMTATTEPGINNPAYQNISKMYQDVLGRAPDAEGMKYWMSTIGQDRSISPEEKAAWMNAAQPEVMKDPNRWLKQSYQDILGRAPDEAGLKYWMDTIGADKSISPEERDQWLAEANKETMNRSVAQQGLPALNQGESSSDYMNRINNTKETGTAPYFVDPRLAGNMNMGPQPPAIGGIANISPGQQIGITDAPGYRGRGTPNFLPSPQTTMGLAAGGIADMAPAYPMNTGGYPRRTGQIDGPGTEKSDSIPAMLSDGEFVMTARAVRGMGKGSRRDGAKKMYALMHQLEKNASRG